MHAQFDKLTALQHHLLLEQHNEEFAAKVPKSQFSLLGSIDSFE
jgi:hypothetical protein